MGGSCDQPGTFISNGAGLVCEGGCFGTITDVGFFCTDYSIDEDWSFGERLVTHNFTGGPRITIAFSGGAWISPFSSSWRVSTTFSLVRRNDTGKINSTPRAITSPVLRIQEGCNHTITIPVTDPDDDIVRCRWAVGDECAGICGGFPGAILDRDICSFAYYANQGGGHRAAAIMIEDFLPGSSVPLSSVGLQFLVLVVDTMRSCSVNPSFVHPTPSDGSCIAVSSGQTLNLRLTADSGYEGDTISEIQTVSPAGLVKSAVAPDPQAGVFYVNITWMPTLQQGGDVHLFCFTATNSGGLSSSQWCIQLLPGHTPPTPVQESATPNMLSDVHPTKPVFQLEFDRQVERPTITSFITFNEFDTGRVVYQINTSSQAELDFPNETAITVTPNHRFEEQTKYYINLDRGVVVGIEGCGPGNEPLTDREFWTFTTRDNTPPIIRLIVRPSVSNANITVSWEGNEPVTWKCNFGTSQLSIEVDCSDSFWSGFNLEEGLYRLEIEATDLANNTASEIHAIRVDTTPPTVQFTSVPGEVSNRQSSFLLDFGCEDSEVCTYQCTFYEGSAAGQPSTCSGFFRTPSLSHASFYTLLVVATDQAGNVGEPARYTWETDFEAPVVLGVANSSSLCTGDLSPDQTGQPEARDNRDPAPRITFHDRKISCSIARTWMAVDLAGNVGTLTQYITLEYEPAVSFVPLVQVSCDSSTDAVSVPTNTATLPNPCSRPLQLSYEDSNTYYTCPLTFTRTWTFTDGCTQTMSDFEQRMSLFDVCPLGACGRNETPPQGICIQGSCICNRPWFGEQCDTLIHSVRVDPVNNLVLEEFEYYSQTLFVVNGTPPFLFSLISSPEGMIRTQESRTVTWRRAQAGNYTITVQVDNEVSSERVSWLLVVRPGYTAVLDPVIEDLYPRATPIELTGRVEYIDGNIIRDLLQGFVPVTVEISSHNGRRELKTVSRGDGTFSTVFFPAPTEYGSYVAGAKHPRSPKATEQTTWDFLGVSVTPRNVRLTDYTVASFTKTFNNVSKITNVGPQALHNITVVAFLQSSDQLRITLTLTGPSSLEPGDSAYIDIHVTSVGALQASFPVRVVSVEGTEVYLFVNLFIAQILPELVVSPPSLTTRVVQGTARSLDFNVTNVGSIEAHMVRAVLPNVKFLSLVNFGTAQQQNEGELTLDSGESAILTVLVSIPPEEPLGEISGQIVVSSMETFQTIHFKVLVSSNVLMNLTVVVEDEYSYFAEGRPLLSNAVVTLTNNVRGLRDTLITGGSGTVTFNDIPEDRYQLRVTGPNHVPVDQILVTSAEQPVHTVFLPRRAVTYSFTVVPTTFEETYTVTLEADFVTHVPIPVVTITPRDISLEPYELGLEDTIQYNITNHGLIRADYVRFQLPTGHPFLEFSTEVEDFGSLDALTSIIVPVKVTRVEEDREKRNVGACFGALIYAISVAYAYVCGDLQQRSASGVLRGYGQFADCDPGGDGDGDRGNGRGRRYQLVGHNGPGGGRHGDVGNGRGGNGPGGGDPSFISFTYTPTEIHCDKCVNSLLSCSPLPFTDTNCHSLRIPTTSRRRIEIPIYTDTSFNFRDLADWSSLIGCIISYYPLAKPISRVFCLPAVFRDCLGADTTIGRRKRSIASIVSATVPYYYAMHEFVLLGVEVLGDERWLRLVSDPMWVAQTFLPAISDTGEGGFVITRNEFNLITSVPPPRNATRAMVKALLERFNNTFVGWSNGTLEPQDGANMVSYSAIQNFSRNINTAQEHIGLEEAVSFLDSYNDINEQYRMVFGSEEEEEGVCAVVRIRIEQEIALTRDAFLAKLEIENMETSDLQRIQMEFLITDVSSGIESTLLFVIGNESLTGSLRDGEGGWVLGSGDSGAAEWLIVPLTEAAPTDNRNYDIGGAFSYQSNGENVTVPLLPTRITVAPDPSLIIHYFWEKFVIGDNPFTAEREPSVPFALGVAVHNAGYGTAMNMRITSGQPEIIENEKGLLVTFKIIGTQVGSERVTPSLSVEFGDIGPTETRVARWLLLSSLQGEFTNYLASFEYMNPLGDPRLYVLDELVLHDLIRNVVVYPEEEDDGVLDFLVNDVIDLFDFPDALYSSKTFTRFNVSTGEVESLAHLDSGRIEVHAVSNTSGWVYFRHEDLDRVFAETKRCINFTKSVGGVVTSLPPENAWVAGEAQPSSRTTDPFFLHIIDHLDEVGEVVYILNPCSTDCLTDGQEFEPIAPPGEITYDVYVNCAFCVTSIITPLLVSYYFMRLPLVVQYRLSMWQWKSSAPPGSSCPGSRWSRRLVYCSN